jgi:hypothetical protein
MPNRTRLLPQGNGSSPLHLPSGCRRFHAPQSSGLPGAQASVPRRCCGAGAPANRKAQLIAVEKPVGAVSDLGRVANVQSSQRQRRAAGRRPTRPSAWILHPDRISDSSWRIPFNVRFGHPAAFRVLKYVPLVGLRFGRPAASLFRASGFAAWRTAPAASRPNSSRPRFRAYWAFRRYEYLSVTVWVTSDRKGHTWGMPFARFLAIWRKASCLQSLKRS